ncbi:MAG: hypothetical protein C4519_04355 [Desulfobacteraceae bacterium]|nr:MAG: hypothetical protein C4519_04355 [Desulfobacteraceae bacterium]
MGDALYIFIFNITKALYVFQSQRKVIRNIRGDTFNVEYKNIKGVPYLVPRFISMRTQRSGTRPDKVRHEFVLTAKIYFLSSTSANTRTSTIMAGILYLHDLGKLLDPYLIDKVEVLQLQTHWAWPKLNTKHADT